MLQLVTKGSQGDSAATSKKRKVTKESDNPICETWLEKFYPESSKAVPCHHSKLTAIRDWLNRALLHHRMFNTQDDYSPFVLVVCGISGCCKSTAVETVCKEMRVDIHVASPDFPSFSTTISRSSSFISSDNSRQSKYKDSQSRQDEAMDYLLHSKYSPLSLSSSSASSSSSSGLHLSSASSSTPRSVSTPRTSSNASSVDLTADIGRDTSAPRIALIHDPPLSGGASRDGSSFGRTTSSGLDGDHSDADAASFAMFISSLRVPTVVVLSDVNGRDDMNYDVDRCIPTRCRNRIQLETMYFPPITTPKLIKALKRIVQLQGLPARVASTDMLQEIAGSSMGDLRHAINQLQFFSNTQRASSASPRSISPAVALSSTATAAAATAKQASARPVQPLRRPIVIDSDDEDAVDVCTPYSLDSCGEGGGSQSMLAGSSDQSFSSLTSVAKLSNATLDSKGMLAFEPDTVFQRSDFRPELLVDFIQWNCIASISNADQLSTFLQAPAEGDGEGVAVMEQLSAALSSFSDVELIASRRYDASAHLDRSDPFFPDEYVSSVTSRLSAVAKGTGAKERIADGKSRGATHIFQPIRRPGILDMRSRARGTQRNLRSVRDTFANAQYSQALEAVSGGNGTIAGSAITMAETATTVIPYLRAMHAVDPMAVPLQLTSLLYTTATKGRLDNSIQPPSEDHSAQLETIDDFVD